MLCNNNHMVMVFKVVLKRIFRNKLFFVNKVSSIFIANLN